MEKPPTAFISYSWDDEAHKRWVRDLATRLRGDGVDIHLDQWEAIPGDQLPAFMERAIRDNRYVLIVCTPRYKTRSEHRKGGVGYEGDIMTAEVLSTASQRKFVPLLRSGTWAEAAPSWLSGKYYVDLSSDPFHEHAYQDLLTTILGTRPAPPPLGEVRRPFDTPDSLGERPESGPTPLSSEIQILGVAVDEVTEPRLDDTRGSALYAVPFRLNRIPTREWTEAFVGTWNRPPRYTMMHRPGIARVHSDRLVLDGTTIEEVEKYHRDTLILCVERANELIAESEAKRTRFDQARNRQAQEHRKKVDDVSRRLNFDD